MALYFIEFATGDYEVPMTSWVVEATDAEYQRIEDALEQLDPEQHDNRYVAPLRIATFEEFMHDMRETWLDEEEDAPAVPPRG